MSAQPTRERAAPRPRTPRAAVSSVAPELPNVRRTTFDAHRWLEQYLAAHAGADAPDRLAGVPLN